MPIRAVAVAVVALVGAGCATVPDDAGAAESGGIVAVSGRCLDEMPDTDGDGLSDACEHALARAFAPRLMMHTTRCTLPSEQGGARVPGGYLHAAQPVHGIVRLVYMPAYYRDCGWTGLQCLIVRCGGHAGDSELIVIDVRRRPSGAWATDAIFLSAHCYGRSGKDCLWYRGAGLARFAWVDDIERGAPIVWVSDARNANYPNTAACEHGHFGLDVCARGSIPYRFPVPPDHNIGSRAVPLHETGQEPGCVSGRFVEPLDPVVVAPQASECFWDEDARFRGWQGGGAGATPYGAYLARLGL